MIWGTIRKYNVIEICPIISHITAFLMKKGASYKIHKHNITILSSPPQCLPNQANHGYAGTSSSQTHAICTTGIQWLGWKRPTLFEGFDGKLQRVKNPEDEGAARKHPSSGVASQYDRTIPRQGMNCRRAGTCQLSTLHNPLAWYCETTPFCLR